MQRAYTEYITKIEGPFKTESRFHVGPRDSIVHYGLISLFIDKMIHECMNNYKATNCTSSDIMCILMIFKVVSSMS